MLLRTHSKITSSTVNGPGRRAVIWVQGCSLACPGCWNPDTHSAMKGQYYDTADLQAWLTELWRTGVIDGVTLSGGEPLEQAHAIEMLVTGLRIAIPLLSIGVFSGYTERELVAGRFRTEGVSSAQRSDLWTRIRTCLDFAVLGRFNKWTPSSRPLVSSRNQKLILISNRYSTDDFEDQGVEITIEADGLTQITGFPVVPIHPA